MCAIADIHIDMVTAGSDILCNILLSCPICTLDNLICAFREIVCTRGCLIIGRSSHLVPGTLLSFPNKLFVSLFLYFGVLAHKRLQFSSFLEHYFVSPVIFHLHFLLA
jgi:hypothetical protein